MRNHRSKILAGISAIGIIALALVLVVPLFLALPVVLILAAGLVPFMWKVWVVRHRRIDEETPPREVDWTDLEEQRAKTLRLQEEHSR